MNIVQIGEWLDVIYKLGVAAFGIWLYLDRRNDKTHIRINKLEERIDSCLDGHSERIVRVETKLTKQPTHDNLAELYREIRQVAATISGLATSQASLQATLEGVDKMVQRMDTFWRNNK